jgi:hypothetical protein
VAVEIQSWREHLQHAEPSSSLTRLCIVLYQVDGAGEWDVTRFWPAMFLRVGSSTFTASMTLYFLCSQSLGMLSNNIPQHQSLLSRDRDLRCCPSPDGQKELDSSFRGCSVKGSRNRPNLPMSAIVGSSLSTSLDVQRGLTFSNIRLVTSCIRGFALPPGFAKSVDSACADSPRRASQAFCRNMM